MQKNPNVGILHAYTAQDLIWKNSELHSSYDASIPLVSNDRETSDGVISFV